MKTRLGALAVVALLAGPSVGPSVAAAQTVTVGPGPDVPPGETIVYRTGLSDWQGQTFLVPLGFPVLQEFRWNIAIAWDQNVPDPSMTLQIHAWDGSAPLGPALFSQLLPFQPNGGDPPVFVGALPLVPGQTYLASLLGANEGVGAPGTFPPGENPYPDGSFVYFDGTAWQTLVGRI